MIISIQRCFDLLYIYLFIYLTVSYLVIFHIFLMMFIWSYWRTIWSIPASPSQAVSQTQQTERLSPKIMHSFEYGLISLQFCLPRTEKELYEREERAEMQQEILKKVARNLPVYTRMPDGGETATKSALVHSFLEKGCRSGNYVIIEKKQQK